MKYHALLLIVMFYVVQDAGCSTIDFGGELIKILIEVIKDTNMRIGHLSNIKQACEGRASFEVGYLTYIIQDKYRRMVDKYHTSHYMRNRYFATEFILPLAEIERHYWEIEHIGNMLHEIERKYGKENGLDKDYELPPTTEIPTVATRPTFSWHTRSKSKHTRFDQNKYINSKINPTLRPKKNNTWWPIEYGVTSCFSLSEFQNKIVNDVSWPIKLKLLKEHKEKTKHSAYRRVGVQAYRMEEVLRDNDGAIMVTTPRGSRDESNMKMKLFRLMYETIRDSDVKIKRAEVIKQHYTNSTSFNLGYVMGEITERFNVMKDIALTMKRLYVEWKPMEHINAYEQIANKAVELCNMVDIARSMLKHDSTRYKRRHQEA